MHESRSRVRALVLANIRSSHNVGAIFRTADAAGVSEIILIGYTPAPIDRFGRVNKEIAKTALGAERTVAWRHEETICDFANELRLRDCAFIGLEQDPRSVDYRDFRSDRTIALLLGNEVDGLSALERAHCEALIEIPMHGAKESLNVSVACGVALFRLSDA